MSNTLGIKRRIRSVGSVRQITKAMQLTAAAKMHKASQAVLNSRPYANRILELANSLEKRGATSHPLMEIRPIKKSLCIVITSDRGMSGSLNGQLIRKILSVHEQAQYQTDYVVIGKQGQIGLRRLGLKIIANYTGIPSKLDMDFLRPVSAHARDEFLKKQYDLVTVAYNHFYSTLTQTPTIKQILPFNTHLSATDQEAPYDKSQDMTESLFEPSDQELLNTILPRITNQLLAQLLLEASASEQAARMVAMQNATDNATELLDDLRLTYNSIRQSAITAEMAEISASIASLE